MVHRGPIARGPKGIVMSLAVASIGTSRNALPLTRPKAHACGNCPARALSICSAMPQEDLGRLAMIRTSQQVAPGETFLNEGDPATHFFNLTSGSVKVYKLLPDGRRQITGFLFPGDLLGLAFNDTYTYSAEALTPVTLCRFPRSQLERLLDEYPKMEKRLLVMASNELAAAQDQMMLLGRKTAQEKVTSFLLALARRDERFNIDGEWVQLTMTRTDIADYLGLTTETVSRIFTGLRQRGCIELQGAGRVKITDHDTLEELAEGSERVPALQS
jgi:CRP/FNR family transcriptional regulator, anaerobic regulatory protein